MMKKNNRPFMILTISGLILTGLAGCTNDTELTGAYGLSAGADTGIVTEQTLAKEEKEDKNSKEDVEATTEDTTEATTEVADKDTSNTTGTSTTGKNNNGSSTGNTNTGTSNSGKSNTGTSTGTSTGSSNTGTSTGNTNTGSSTGNTNTSGNSGNTNPPATEAPATEAPATEATTEATVAYYRDWDYICRRTNELLQQNFPGATIGRHESCQTYTDYDGYPFPLAYSDEAYAQGMYDMIANDLTGRGIYPGDATSVTTGVFLEYIEDSNSPKYENQRTIHLTYYK